MKIIEILYNPFVYAISLTYCVWRIIKRYEKTSLDGVIGTGPAGETLAYSICPAFFAVMDMLITLGGYLFKKK